MLGDDGNVQHLVTTADAYLLVQIARGMDKERRCEGGHLDSDLALLVGHGRIVAVVECLHLNTGKRSLRSSINDDALDFHRGVLRLLDRCLLLDDSFLNFFVIIFHIVLGECRQAGSKRQENAHAKNIMSFHIIFSVY